MNPSEIIAAALTGGVVAVSAGKATKRVLDAYLRLRVTLVERVPDEATASTLFDEFENHPERADILVHKIVRDLNARVDDELYHRAMELIDLLEASGSDWSMYRVGISRSRGMQIGDHSIQTNTFSVGEG